MTTLVAVLLGAIPGYAAGAAALVASGKHARRQMLALRHLREEFEVRFTQQKTECRDSVRSIAESVEFLEESTRQTEEVLANRLTTSQRGKAMQLLRSGLPPEKTAATLGMSRNEVRLIATVSEVCHL